MDASDAIMDALVIAIMVTYDEHGYIWMRS